jgi:hypothetical protein
MEVAEEKVFEDNNDDVRHGETAEEVQEDEADGGSMEEGSRRYSEEKLAQIGSTISTEDIEVVVKAESKIIAGGVDVDGAEEKTVMHLSESKDEAKKYQAKAGEESPMNKARTRRRWQMSSTEEKAEEKARENKAEQKDEQAESKQQAGAKGEAKEHKGGSVENEHFVLWEWLKKRRLNNLGLPLIDFGFTLEKLLKLPKGGVTKPQFDQMDVHDKRLIKRFNQQLVMLQRKYTAALEDCAEAAVCAACMAQHMASEVAVVVAEAVVAEAIRVEFEAAQRERDWMAEEEAVVWLERLGTAYNAGSAAVALGAAAGARLIVAHMDAWLAQAMVAEAKSKKQERKSAELAAELTMALKGEEQLERDVDEITKEVMGYAIDVQFRADANIRAIKAAQMSKDAAKAAVWAVTWVTAMESKLSAEIDEQVRAYWMRVAAKRAALVAAEVAAAAAISAIEAAAMAYNEYRKANKFPIYRFTGEGRRLGLQHGRALGERIHETWDFYHELWLEWCGLTDADLLEAADVFMPAIRKYSRLYTEEIDAIAEAAKIEPWKVYLLNARTEVMNWHNRLVATQRTPMEATYANPWVKESGLQMRKRGPSHYDARHHLHHMGITGIGECTSAFSTKHGLLAHNWDNWDMMEQLAVIFQLDSGDGRRALIVTEPGVLAKFGINSDGVAAVCSTCQCRESVGGVPMALLMRTAITRPSLAEAAGAILAAPRQTMGCIMVGDDRGAYHMLELFGPNVDNVMQGGGRDDVHTHTNEGAGYEFLQDRMAAKTFSPVVVRTNHYLTQNPLMLVCGGNDRDVWGISGSEARYERLQSLLASTFTSDVETLKELLGDRNKPDPDHPIQITFAHLSPEPAPISEEEQMALDKKAREEAHRLEKEGSKKGSKKGGKKGGKKVGKKGQLAKGGMAKKMAKERGEDDGEDDDSDFSEEEAEEDGEDKEPPGDLGGVASALGAMIASPRWRYGTVCRIVFDMQNRTMHITRGNPDEIEWEAIQISDATGSTLY